MIDRQILGRIERLIDQRHDIAKGHAAFFVIDAVEVLHARIGHLFDVLADLDLRDDLPVLDDGTQLVHTAKHR